MPADVVIQFQPSDGYYRPIPAVQSESVLVDHPIFHDQVDVLFIVHDHHVATLVINAEQCPSMIATFVCQKHVDALPCRSPEVIGCSAISELHPFSRQQIEHDDQNLEHLFPWFIWSHYF